MELPPVVTLPVPLKGIFTPDVLRSDHAPFWYQQIPAVLVTDTANLRSPHYHQPSDTLENLDREFFLGSAQVVVNTLAKLLNPDIP
ncbi:MAG: M28 family peptidase [Oscillatoriales cyanobacterium RM2_1_1]|nr:M28 family peptidase [Oscillatoriales cyanobacterium RM2_1_1]